MEAKEKAAADVQNAMQAKIDGYITREDEARKRASKREDHDMEEQRKESGAKRNVQFMNALAQIGPISGKQARLIERQMCSEL